MLNRTCLSTLAAKPALPDTCTVTLADVSQEVIRESDAQRLLSQAEAYKASKFRSPERCWQYIQCHALLRVLLAEHVALDASKITFCKGEYDKPALSGESASSGIAFNLSHSGPLAVIAISSGANDVGVDIEQIKSGRNTREIADHFFAPAERQAIRSLPCSEQEEAFFSCWSRKESFIKATGLGLQLPLDRFVVTVDPTASAELLWLDYEHLKFSRWQMYTLLTPAGYAGALTLSTQGVN